MPITIKNSLVKVKNSNGEYVGINAVAEATTETQITSIQGAGQQQINSIQAKGEETIASIPSDYTTLSDSVGDLKSALENVEGTLYNVEKYDFSQIGITDWPYGWRTGYYSISSTGGTSSASYARTRAKIGLVNVDRLSFTPPSGYASSILLGYTEDGAIKYDIIGAADSTSSEGREYIDKTITIDCHKYETAAISVGKFTNSGGSTEFVQDGNWVDSMSLLLYIPNNSKLLESIDDTNEYLGLNDYDLQDGYYNSSKVDRLASSQTMATKKIKLIGSNFILKCPGYNVSIYYFKTVDQAAFLYTNNLYGDYIREIVVPDEAKYVAINITKSQTLTDEMREDIKEKFFFWQYNENEFRFATEGANVRIVTLNKQVEPAFPAFKAGADLRLLHFSDIHALSSDTNLARIITYYQANQAMLDDILSTGDNVHEYYGDVYTAFTDKPGAGKILTVLGNHDVADGTIGSHYVTGATEAELSAKFFYGIDSWGVTHPTDKTYWYKDYASGIRLIGINSSLDASLADLNDYSDRKTAMEAMETTQLDWLESVLNDAKTNNKDVVIASHFGVKNAVRIPCTFSSVINSLYSTAGKSLSENIQAKVQDFIDGGGKFICYLSGHAHFDMLCYNANYPNQLNIVVTTANKDLGEHPREYATKSQDAFNLISFDKTRKLIRIIRVGADRDLAMQKEETLCINYETKTVLANN